MRINLKVIGGEPRQAAFRNPRQSAVLNRMAEAARDARACETKDEDELVLAMVDATNNARKFLATHSDDPEITDDWIDEHVHYFDVMRHAAELLNSRTPTPKIVGE